MTVEQSMREFCVTTKRVSTSTTIALWVCLLTTIALFITSALLPPKGEIHPSMFKAAAYLFAFGTLIVTREAIREGLGVKLTHGDTTVEIKDTDGPGHQAPLQMVKKPDGNDKE